VSALVIITPPPAFGDGNNAVFAGINDFRHRDFCGIVSAKRFC
jgi:hypothetical protein